MSNDLRQDLFAQSAVSILKALPETRYGTLRVSMELLEFVDTLRVYEKITECATAIGAGCGEANKELSARLSESR